MNRYFIRNYVYMKIFIYCYAALIVILKLHFTFNFSHVFDDVILLLF